MKNPISFSSVILGDEQQLGVNARDVHTALEVKSEFSHWINRRIKQCKFEENFDYILIVKKDEQVSGAKYLNEYIITLPKHYLTQPVFCALLANRPNLKCLKN